MEEPRTTSAPPRRGHGGPMGMARGGEKAKDLIGTWKKLLGYCRQYRVALVVALAVLLSCLFHYVPGLNAVPSGWALILAAVTASAVGAWRFPHVEPQGGAAS